MFQDQIYKMHVRPHLDYCDFIYHSSDLDKYKDDKLDSTGSEYSDDCEGDTDLEDHVSDIVGDPDDARSDSGPNLNFCMKVLESIQYQAALAIISGA